MANVPISRRNLAIALSCVAFPGLALADQQQPPPVTTAPTRVLDSARRLTVQVFLNDQGPFSFLVDTGANASVISSALASQLSLPAGKEVNLHGIAGVQVVGTVTIDRVRVGRRERRDLVLSVLPDRHLSAPGILGMDWLGSQGLTLDVAGRQMHVGASLPKTDEYSVSVPAKIQRSGLSLIEALAGGVRTLCFLDTGSTTTVGNQALMDAAVRKREITSDWADLQLVSLTGQTLAGRLAALKRLRFGSIALVNLPVVFGPVHTFDYWGISDRPALLLGMDVLSIFQTVSLDYRRGAVHFQLSSTTVDRGAATS
ncbi:retroviral-like aspartic protease family protein [Caulobacter sp. BK020]|uniref:retroviral-like aspartic protease family protein n=1 Tax=Caulobacter sp. BK020 TaxID=2512117 RepID=UPI00104326C3|nr:retroviral-like aspartic protease family protein [Caulobacter sp. BK020]TCS15888.1 aspartyl protease [Caulobacter sp. BK020]